MTISMQNSVYSVTEMEGAMVEVCATMSGQSDIPNTVYIFSEPGSAGDYTFVKIMFYYAFFSSDLQVFLTSLTIITL